MLNKGVIVRKLTLSFVLCLGLTAWARPDAVIADEKISDPELAEIRISVTDYGEPTFAPYQMKITVLCKDNRVSKTTVVPKWIPTRPAQAICAWGSHTYDSSSKKLSVTFSEAAMVVGDAPCETAPPKSMDIKKVCARWNK
jgi:hypothetical protein